MEDSPPLVSDSDPDSDSSESSDSDSDSSEGSVDSNDSDTDSDEDENDSDTTSMSVDSDSEGGASAAFIHFLITLLMLRTLTARHFCSIMWYAWKAGISACKKYSLNPQTKSSGHFNRKVKQSVGIISTDGMYNLKLPGRTKRSLGRVITNMPVYLPHESLLDEVGDDVEAWLDTFEGNCLERGDVPTCYSSHPVVVRGGRVLPISVFVDGVPYSHHDSVIGYWLINPISRQRHLFAVVRKTQCCRCGCRGWCTYHEIWRCLHWSLLALADKRYPTARHDHLPWDLADIKAGRDAVANMEMHVAACCLYCQGDWSEYASTFGLTTWGDGVRPCYKCNCGLETMQDLRGISAISGGVHRENTKDDFIVAATKCEKLVILDKRTHVLLSILLRYGKGKNGSHGLALKSHHACLAPLGLAVGMRVEPSEYLSDVGFFPFELIPVSGNVLESGRRYTHPTPQPVAV